MSKELQPPQPSEEVDLGQLFKFIGNAFARFFNFIGRILKGIFNTIISFLIFIQGHIIKFAIAGFVGLGLGFYLDATREPNYISNMVVEPNFNSVTQLYNNVEFYNALAEAKDYDALSEALNISKKEAKYIKKFRAESFLDENQKLQLFDKFVRSLDTTNQKTVEIKTYLENFNELDARFHTVIVEASNNNVVKKIQPALINSISRNEYFKLQKGVNDINITLQDSLYSKQIRDIDSLKILYKKVMLKEADKQVQGTNINLADNGAKENKELALIDKMEQIKSGLVALNQERANKSSILNVISEFPNKGVKDNHILKSYKFIIPCLLIGFMMLFFALVSLNTYLKNYKK